MEKVSDNTSNGLFYVRYIDRVSVNICALFVNTKRKEFRDKGFIQIFLRHRTIVYKILFNRVTVYLVQYDQMYCDMSNENPF